MISLSAGTASSPLPTVTMRSSLMVTTALLITFVPSQSLPNRTTRV